MRTISFAWVLFLSVYAVSAFTVDCGNTTIQAETDACSVAVESFDPMVFNITNTTYNYWDGLMTTYPIGTSIVVYHVADLSSDETSNCTYTIDVVPIPGSSPPCGYGACSAVDPFECVCPEGTSGDFCCFEVGNTTCGGPLNGVCTLGAVCECLPGYDGLWCCPSSAYGLCSGVGCCLSTGTCECSTRLDPACTASFFTALQPKDSNNGLIASLVVMGTMISCVSLFVFLDQCRLGSGSPLVYARIPPQ
jgi:hypothetical protein